MLKFVEPTQAGSTLKTIGTVSEFAGVGGTFEPSSVNNLKGSLKANGKLTRVTVRITNAEGKVAFVNCSDKVSEDIRSKTLNWSDLGSLNILELPQFESDGTPIMQVDPETGEAVQMILYLISHNGSANTGDARVTVTETMVNSNPIARSVNWGELIAL